MTTETQLGLAYLVAIGTRYRLPLGGLFLLCVIGSAVAAFVMTPVYRAEVLVAPVSADEGAGLLDGLAGQFGSIAALAGVSLGGSDTGKAEALATLQSRILTGEFLKEYELLPKIFADDWDAGAGDWDVGSPEDIPTLWDGFEEFDENIRFVTENRVSGLVTLAIEWNDPDEAAEWANDLIARTNRVLRERAIAEANKSLQYLNEELEKTTIVELSQAIYGLIEAQINTIMVANVREEYAFKIIDPAVAPDSDDFVRPRRVMILAVGSILGLFLVGAVSLFLGALGAEPRGYRAE